MIGITIITHGDLAQGLQHSTEMIMGKVENMNHVSLREGADLDAFSTDVKKAVKEVNSGKGVIVFVDMFGATPFNTIARSVNELKEENIEVNIVTGVNLPILMETLVLRQSETLESLHKTLAISGKTTIESYRY